MDEQDIRLLKAVQDGVKLIERPYQALGEELGISEEEAIRRLAILVDEGIIRRFAAVIGHRALGIMANAMIVWKAPEDDVLRIGELMASFEDVTHCYERPACAKWPYNLYTMVHGQSEGDCHRIARQISQNTGIKDYRLLFSKREHKKSSMRYFERQ